MFSRPAGLAMFDPLLGTRSEALAPASGESTWSNILQQLTEQSCCCGTYVSTYAPTQRSCIGAASEQGPMQVRSMTEGTRRFYSDTLAQQSESGRRTELDVERGWCDQ